MDVVCRICGDGSSHPRFRVRETMFGLDEAFDYFQCANCGCLQIESFPADMARYYPSEYHSLSVDPQRIYAHPVKGRLQSARDRYAITGKGLVGGLVHRSHPNLPLASLRPLRLDHDSRILDVGSGVGLYLYGLQRLGFRRLLGIDPHLEEDLFYPPSLRIERRTIHEVEGEWDVIMFHHSFEHVADPLETLESVHRILGPGGVCLIRVPVVSSEAWQRYGVDWVQIDAPRHFILHSTRSMEVAADRTGFRVDQVRHDSNAYQFWGSEQVRMGITLQSEKSYRVNPDRSQFTRRHMRRFERDAKRLNARGAGDQAIFLLRRAGD